MTYLRGKKYDRVTIIFNVTHIENPNGLSTFLPSNNVCRSKKKSCLHYWTRCEYIGIYIRYIMKFLSGNWIIFSINKFKILTYNFMLRMFKIKSIFKTRDIFDLCGYTYLMFMERRAVYKMLCYIIKYWSR